ncbi:MAG: copper-binding protein [Betaproteobacteria bacterium]|nr:copper-binding protein [Betaproteobacteria bacterium]
MKILVCTTILALTLPATTLAQEMKSMDSMDMTGMEQQAGKGNTVHKAVGVVKKVDAKAGKVTLAHDPVKTMNWPAMTMAFAVQDKTMLNNLREGQKVEFEFDQRGKESVITSVK